MSEDVFLHRDTREGDVTIDVAFTGAPLDLAETPDSDATRLAGALGDLSASCGVGVVRMRQVHGAHVEVVDAAPAEPPTADALVTTRRGVGLLTRSADCVPVLLAASRAGVVGAVHAGRPGLAAGVVPAAVERMREQGASEIEAWLGPHVCGLCYEVPADLRDEVSRLVPAARSETSWGTPALDIGAGVLAQLSESGVPATTLGICTREDDRVWSYRRDGSAAGRMGGVVWMRP